MYRPMYVPAGLANVVAVAAGGNHAVALNRIGTVIAWGDTNAGEVTVPPGLTNVVAIAGGFSHSLALKADGTIAGWGFSGYGAEEVPASLTDVVAIAAGSEHSMALKTDGTVVVWGHNVFGQATVPPDLSNVVAIAAGGGFRFLSLALKSDGTVVGWGDNYYGEATGVPTTNRSPFAATGQVMVAGEVLSNVVAIAAGDSHSLALRCDGTMAAWGSNLSGQTDVPAGLTNVVAIAAGNMHSLALRADGTVVAWGAGSVVDQRAGQYGQSLVPGGLGNAVGIAGGRAFSLALVGNGPPVIHTLIADPRWDTNCFSVSVPTQSGRVYRLEYKTSLANADWTALPLVAGNGGVRTLTDATATGAQRFYRVRQW